MDQLKTALKVLQKHHFWILAGICMISGVVGWMKATGALSTAYTQKKGNILSAFSGLDTIQASASFPNGKWKEEVSKLKEKQEAEVGQAWSQLYNEQKKVLHWPKVLESGFLNEIEKIPPGGEIPRQYCNIYATNIQREIPNLLAIIKAEPEGDTGGGKAKNSGEPRVDWAGQADVQKHLIWKSAPRSAEVWLAQEDLWVYASVLTIISKINGDQYILRIPRIETLSIGTKAAEALAKGMASGHIDSSAEKGGGGDDQAQGGAQQQQQPAGGEAAETAADEGRYVDAKGKPLPGGSAAKEPFKRMPVFMKLAIDQREIPRLLAECNNSPLPIDVRQLRINPGKGAAPNSGNSGSPSPSSAQTKELDTYNVSLELAGIIYIYNKPPDKNPSSGQGDQPTTTAAAPAPAGGAPGG